MADVDGDGEAELVVVTDNWWGGVDPGRTRLRRGDRPWANARPLWNQYAYSVSNINDDGSRAARTRAAISRWVTAGPRPAR